MKSSSVAARLLVGTALCFPFAGAVHSQTLADITEEDLAGYSEECRLLVEEYRALADPTIISEDAIIVAVTEDVVEDCVRIREEIAVAVEQTQAEEVEVTEEATIAAEAEVMIPEPNVDVQVPAPTVQLTEQQPQVTIREQPTELQVQQARPTIAVEIPEIRVRVEIPAPQFYMLRPDPEVAVDSPAPEVQVEQGEPVVSVSQGDPELALDLGREGGPVEGGAAVDEAGDANDAVDAQVEAVSPEPQIEIIQAEGEPEVILETAEPVISYQSVDPEVTVMMAEQPIVELEQTGEPTVILETLEERELRLQEQQGLQEQPEQDEASVDPAALQPELEPELEQPEQAAEQPLVAQDMGEQPEVAAGGLMTVSELKEMDVFTVQGENIGNPEAVVDINGEPALVVSSGGFLGLGESQIAVPLSSITVENDRLVLDTLTQEEIESAEGFEYDRNLELPDDEQISVGGM